MCGKLIFSFHTAIFSGNFLLVTKVIFSQELHEKSSIFSAKSLAISTYILYNGYVGP